MTTGDLLVSMSTLSSGKAIDHLSNISFGGGGGLTMYVERVLMGSVLDDTIQASVINNEIEEVNYEEVIVSGNISSQDISASILINEIGGSV